ncbi:MAG: hypothetical protein KAQ99_01420 [Candidatus Aureabacteria bacterium]|nr:hypothetical protein [Candidatus Auribacterota bacterium]MCK5160209.1 hypothetical protein [Candidatus Auribacterota bacterium]
MKYNCLKEVTRYWDDLPIRLKLQEKTPEQGKKYWAISIRTTYLNSTRKNRRFYYSKKIGFWTIPTKIIVELLKEAEEKELFDKIYNDKYERFEGGTASFIYSDKTPDYQKHLNKITCFSKNEPEWIFKKPFFVISQEPGNTWRKIMIVKQDFSLITFRSCTTEKTYRPKIYMEDDSLWFVDNAMMDVSVQVMKIFKERLFALTQSI